MKAKIFFIFLFLAFIFFLIYQLRFSEFLLFSNFNLLSEETNFLVLGKPGPGYIGSENTDSLIVAHLVPSKNALYLIPIPRDLIVKDEKGNLEKINALYEKGKVDLLFKKASELTGFNIKNYLVFDLTFAKNIIDELGGIEVYLPEPVTDAVTLYTIPEGKHKLDGYLAELVLRSRYNPEGDFFRVKNQIEVLKGIKEKIANLNSEEKVKLLRFLDKERYHWQTNLKKEELLKIALKVKDFKNLTIIPITFDSKNGLLTSGYFNIYNTENVYGIYPKLGVDNYRAIQVFIQAKIK